MDAARRSSALRTTGASGRLTSGAAVIALHIVFVVLLLQLEPVRSALTATAPVIVRIILPPQERPQDLPKPLPATTPRIQRPRQPLAPPTMTAVTEAPAPYVAPAPPPEPLPPMEASPAPAEVVGAPAPAPSPAPIPVTPPQFNAAYLNNPAPAYPALSRRMGEEGKVVLRVFVDERGLPAEVQLKTSSGFSRLDSTALETVRSWKFVAARHGDTPLGAWVLVPISFSLRS